MADINVERKKKSIWPWILGAIAVLLLIWAFAAMNDNDADTAYAPATVTAPAAVSDPAAIDAETDTTAVTAADADTTETTPPPTE